MSFALIIFIASLLGIVVMIAAKMSVFKDKHIHVWVSVRSATDEFIHNISRNIKEHSGEVKHKSLLKIVSMVYDGLIPFIERQYRKVAGWLYKLHRKVWSLLEHSKSSTKHVSQYLHDLSEHKKNTPL